MKSSPDIPATPGVKLGPREEGESKGYWPYREAVGSLMWLSTMTRPDVSNAVRPGRVISQHHRQALEGSSEDNGIPPRDKGYGIDFCEGFGIGFNCV